MLSLDTHILIDFLRGNLLPRERKLLEGHELGISAIVLWELAKLKQLGRIDLDLGSKVFREVIGCLQILPLSFEVAELSCRLDLRGDPADEIIVACSIVYGAPLVTRDRAIRASKRALLAS